MAYTISLQGVPLKSNWYKQLWTRQSLSRFLPNISKTYWSQKKTLTSMSISLTTTLISSLWRAKSLRKNQFGPKRASSMTTILSMRGISTWVYQWMTICLRKTGHSSFICRLKHVTLCIFLASMIRTITILALEEDLMRLKPFWRQKFSRSSYCSMSRCHWSSTCLRLEKKQLGTCLMTALRV